MTVFEKARELSDLILDTENYKRYEKARKAYQNNLITPKEFSNSKKEFDSFIDQICMIIKFKLTGDEEFETDINRSCCKCRKE